MLLNYGFGEGKSKKKEGLERICCTFAWIL